MSQELIAIIGAAIVAVALAAPVHAQVDCADWNTAAFFEVAGVLDVTRCLQIGADPDARDKDGKSPLHFATDNGSAEAVMALLDASADHDVWDRSGFTPLHRAAAHGNAEAVTALLDAGADPNIRGEAGMTPLHGAGTAGAVAALIEAGADPNAGDNDGKLPVDYAADNEQLKDTDGYWKLNDARFQSREIGEGVFRIGEITDPPTVIYRRDPIYSEDARKAQYEGTVVLEAIVRKDGSVEIVRVVRGLGLGLDENAMEALSEWRFSPAMRNGQPVDVPVNIEFNFTLR